MQNTRAYGARLSGLIFFLLALGIVGTLVYLTVRSARDNASTVSTTDTSDTTPAEDQTPAEGTPAPDTDQGTVAGTDSNDEPSGDRASDEEGVVSDEAASTTAESTPPTATPSIDEEEAEDNRREVVAAATDRNLPDTGPESALIAAVAFAVIAGGYNAFRNSEKLLQAALLKNK